jgi:hypothetical protein
MIRAISDLASQQEEASFIALHGIGAQASSHILWCRLHVSFISIFSLRKGKVRVFSAVGVSDFKKQGGQRQAGSLASAIVKVESRSIEGIPR